MPGRTGWQNGELTWSSLVRSSSFVMFADSGAAGRSAPVVVNVLEAKTHLSRLLEDIEQGACKEVVIARRGRPIARLTQLEPSRQPRRLGLAKGVFVAPPSIDAANEELADWFEQP